MRDESFSVVLAVSVGVEVLTMISHGLSIITERLCLWEHTVNGWTGKPCWYFGGQQRSECILFLSSSKLLARLEAPIRDKSAGRAGRA